MNHGLVRQVRFGAANNDSAGSVALCDVGAAADSYGVPLVWNLMHKLLKYKGARDQLKIEWRDQSCMKLD